MNNNNRNNNRRRGRGSNNRQGGGQQVNRIDSRARGNAPQMLEKYRKLALDSHMNGDRVNEEYYLQFADHYFRVIADTRVRQEESRVRRDDRWQDGGETGSEREFDYAEDAVDPYDDMRLGNDMRQVGGERPAADRQDSDRRGSERQGSDRAGDERQDRYSRSEGQDRPERQDRFGRQDRPDRDRASRSEQQNRGDREPRGEQPTTVSTDQVEPFAPTPSQAADTLSVYEPPENPFVRGDREGRGLKQRRPRRAASEEQIAAEPATGQDEVASADGPSALDVFDPAILPPAVALRRADPDTDEAASDVVAEEAPKPRRRTRRPRATDGSDEALQAVN